MTRRKGELSRTAIDNGWPYQVAVREIDGQPVIIPHGTTAWSSLCPRGWKFADDRHRYRVYCFADEAQAEEFRILLDGFRVDPTQRSIHGPG